MTDSDHAPRLTRSRTRRVLRYAAMVGLPFVVLPLLLPRRAHARKPAGPPRATSRGRAARAGRLQEIQQLVDDYRRRLGISANVVADIVPANQLVVSVARAHGADAPFALSIEEAFLDTLTDDEIAAVVAHELGHVWIFTHHPYLQTEEGANDVALRLVSREVLTGVYDKVWRRAGTKGDLTYLPAR